MWGQSDQAVEMTVSEDRVGSKEELVFTLDKGVLHVVDVLASMLGIDGTPGVEMDDPLDTVIALALNGSAQKPVCHTLLQRGSKETRDAVHLCVGGREMVAGDRSGARKSPTFPS